MEGSRINGRPSYIEMNKEDGDPFQRKDPVSWANRVAVSSHFQVNLMEASSGSGRNYVLRRHRSLGFPPFSHSHNGERKRKGE